MVPEHLPGTSFQNAIVIDDDAVPVARTPVIVLSDDDDDDKSDAGRRPRLLQDLGLSRGVQRRNSLRHPACISPRLDDHVDHGPTIKQGDVKPIISQPAAGLEDNPTPNGVDHDDDNPVLEHDDTKPDISPEWVSEHDHQAGERQPAEPNEILRELDYDLVRHVLEMAMPDYTPWSQHTGQHQICIFTRLETPWFFGFVHEQPASFTLVFGCRDRNRQDVAFTVNCLFIQARFAALKLGSLPSVEQLSSLNPLLSHALAYYAFVFDDEQSVRSQTSSFVEAVQILIDFLSIDDDAVLDNDNDRPTREWFLSRAPIASLQASCKVCHCSGPDANHYSEHEREIWAKLSLDQRDQVFGLASDRRRRIRSSVAALNQAAATAVRDAGRSRRSRIQHLM